MLAALTLAGCQTDGQPSASLSSPRAKSVAFESIDGMPRGAFDTLVQRLNDEAQTRPLAIASRDEPSAYRVKGYVSAVRTRGQASIVWTFDVYDSAQSRSIRLTGEEKTAGKFKNAWAAADDAMLRRVARNSLDQLAAFLARQPAEGDANSLASSAYVGSPRS
jgi:hypothetical protein